MSDLITKKELKMLRKNALIIDTEAILSGKALLKFPEHFVTNSGYTIGMSIESYPEVKMEHISISNRKGELDAASFDCIAFSILGEFVFIGSLTNANVYHYLKFISGNKKRFDDYIEFMKKGARI